MCSDLVGWKIVPNTVTSRMIDSSFRHKLIPCRRLRRSSKAMNIVIKQHRNLKTYSQYVKIRTCVLRNLPDDDETDDDCLSETDYNTLYKSDLSSTNCRTLKSNENMNYLSETKDEIDKEGSAVDCTRKKQFLTQKQKNKCRNILNSTNRKNVTSRSFVRSEKTNGCKDIQNSLQTIGREKQCPISLETSSMTERNGIQENCETCIVDVAKLNIEIVNSINLMHNDTKVPQICGNDDVPIEEIVADIKDNNKGSKTEENYYCGIYNSRETHVLDRNTESFLPVECATSVTKKSNDPFANIRICSDESQSSLLKRNLYDHGIYEDKNECISSRNQPKDSGIEEDTEEEFSENGSKNYKIKKSQNQQIAKNVQDMLPILGIENSCIDEAGLSTFNNYVLSEECSISNDTDSNDTRLSNVLFDKDAGINNENTEEAREHRLQPTVTSMEIVNKKYKIISCSTELLNDCPNPEVNANNFHSQLEEVFETEGAEQNIEDSVSPLTKKRLQQLRRLNLTIESESSASEDDNMYSNGENTRHCLSKYWKESGDTLDNENEHTSSKVLSEHATKLGKSKPEMKDYQQRNSSRSTNKSETYVKMKKNGGNKELKKEESIKSLDFTELNNKFTTNLLMDLQSKETYRQNFSLKYIKQDIAYSNDKDGTLKENLMIQNDDEILRKYKLNQHESVHSVRIDNCDKAEEKFNDGNQSVEGFIQVSNEKKLVTYHRPCNLQELIEKENLIRQTAASSFRFKNIEEDDELFILDIPAAAFDKSLLGKKMILTENKLKLGKQKYKLEYKDIGNVSCIFGGKKSDKPYKTVNIKPTARIVASQKVIKQSLWKSLNESLNDETNCIEDTSKMEDNEALRKYKRIEVEHSVIPFERKKS